MKKTINNLALFAFCWLVISCNKSEELTENKANEGQSQYVGEVGQAKTLELTSIEDLNQEEVVINSHAESISRSSLMMDYRSYIEIGSGQAKVAAPVYPRIKKMANGKYILFYQNNQIGADTYYLTSSDLKTWIGGDRLFARYSVVDLLGANNERRFSTCNALVLSNGDLIAVVSYRVNNNYQILPKNNGLLLRRSKDNGLTWGDPVEIYQGTNWEPFLLQLPSGEIQCYFTDSHTDVDEHNSGTAMISSSDNGYTWTPSFGNTPYRVIRQKYGEKNGVSLFTDQMPGVTKLNNSNQLAAALESYNNTSKYYLSLAYTGEDGQWAHLGENEIGPADRSNYIFAGAAPSLVQFPSGETLLSYNTASAFTLRLGDVKARKFGDMYVPFSKTGFWGTLEMVNPHVVIGSMHTDGAIMLSRFVLNHNINATNRSVRIDGDNSDWSQKDEALFVGQKSQAQATLRCSFDDKNIYFLIEVQDKEIAKEDYVSLFLSSPGINGELKSDASRFKVWYYGLKSTDRYNGSTWNTADMKALISTSVDGKVSNSNGTDNGYLVELAIPKSQLNLSSGSLLVNLSLFDKQGGEDAIADTADRNTNNWVAISF